MNKKLSIAIAAIIGIAAAIAVQAATVYKPSALFDSQLSQALTATATSSMALQKGVDKSGNSLTGAMCFTVDGGLSNVEYICGTASGTTISNLTRGIDFTNGVTSSTTLQSAHRIGADVKVTDFPYLSQYARLLNGDDSLPNAVAYNSSVTTSTLGMNNSNLASVGYVNSVAIAGAPNGSLSVKGIYQEATTAQFASSTNVGSTGADLINTTRFNSLTASTSPVNVIASGTIDPSYLLNGNYALGSMTVQSLTSVSTTFGGNVVQSSGTASFASTTVTGQLAINGTVSSTASFLTERDGSVLFNSSTTTNTQSSTIVLGFAPKIIGISAGFTCAASNGSGNFNQSTGGSAVVNASGTAIGGMSYSTAANSAGGGQTVITGIGNPASGFSCSVNGTVIGQSISIGITSITGTSFTITATSTEITGSSSLVPGTITWYAIK